MKISSVEYFREEIVELLYNKLTEDEILKIHYILERSKIMHKQEIIEATKYGNSFEQGDLICENYYKNTYEKEN